MSNFFHGLHAANLGGLLDIPRELLRGGRTLDARDMLETLTSEGSLPARRINWRGVKGEPKGE